MNSYSFLAGCYDQLTYDVDYSSWADYIEKHFEGVTVSKPQGTYMLFLDCTGWCEAHGKTMDELERMCWDVGVALQDGRMFHGPYHLRVNLALPLHRVREAFHRLDKYVFNAESAEKCPPDFRWTFLIPFPFSAHGHSRCRTARTGTPGSGWQKRCLPGP